MSTETTECLKLHLVMKKRTGQFDAAAVEDIHLISSNRHPGFKANVSKAMLRVHVNNSKE